MPSTLTPPDRSRVPEPGPLRPFNFPPIERTRLANGLPVLLARMDGLPVVTWSLVLEAAGVHEAPGKAGLATLTTSLLESGAGKWSAAEIAEALETLGTQLATGTSWDASHLDLTVLSPRLEAATEIHAELLRRPAFPEPEVERIRHEQLASIIQRRAEPRGLANEMASRFIFHASSPFHRPLSGTRATVESLQADDVRSFYGSRYHPSCAALIIAGDVDPERAVELAERRFGDWRGEPAPRVVPPATPAAEERRVLVVDRPGSVQAEIRIGHVAVARDTPDYFPLLVMNSILGGAFSSRLNLNLRERHGYTYGVSSAFATRRAPGPFLVSTAVQTEVTAPAVAEIFREIEKMRAEPVTAAELADARTYLAGTFPLRLQTTDGVASRLAEMVLYDLPEDYFDHYRDRILAVSADEVLRVARDHLHPDRMAVVVVGDAAAVQEPLEALQLGTARRVAPEDGG